jgi:hypothetical protein
VATTDGSGGVQSSATATAGSGGGTFLGGNAYAGTGGNGGDAKARSIVTSGRAVGVTSSAVAPGGIGTTVACCGAGGGVGGAGGTAVANANIGTGVATLIPISGGQAESDATRAPANIGVGAISAGYGGLGETLTYNAEADFTFATVAPEPFYLTLLDNNAAGAGFDELTLHIVVNGSTILTLDTRSLIFAEGFFTDHKLDLGWLGAGPQTVDILYSLTASEIGAGFGFTYNAAVPEPSSWAMMLLGFAGLGFAGYRRAATAA